MECLVRNFVLLMLLGMTSGCSTLPPRHPVPVDQMYHAQILPGVPAVRAWGGTFSKQFGADLVESVHQEKRAAIQKDAAGLPGTSILTLSGGADYGAFGAGFMNGWTRSATRPSFKLVTGISTGALIAPFAFLGPEYDGVLKKAYTTISAEDIYQERGLSALWSDSLADSAPLARLIAKYIDQDILLATAQAHRQGRRLYIGTTHLDADRLVVWNMGAIANSGHPKALELFRKVILASSSVPIAFPPVFIEVKVGGVSYDEMHADGGLKAQLFLTAVSIDTEEIKRQLGLQETSGPRTKLFVIRNAVVGPEPKQVPRKLTEISERTVTSFIKSQARRDLVRLYTFAHEQGFDFNWVSLPNEYIPPEVEPFDTAEMNRLFNIGYEMGLKGNVWRKVPPKIGQH